MCTKINTNFHCPLSVTHYIYPESKRSLMPQIPPIASSGCLDGTVVKLRDLD